MVCLLSYEAIAYSDTSTMTDVDFFNKINLDYPGLSAVKADVQSGNYTAAKADLLTYMKNRTSPVYIDQGKTTGDSPLISAADELVNYIFKFSDGQQQTFPVGNINWDYHWSPGDPSQLGAPHDYILDFMMNHILVPSYNALAESDPKRTQYADAWMKMSLEYIADKGNSNIGYDPDSNNNYLRFAKRTANWIAAYSVFKNSSVIDANGNIAYLKHLWQMTDFIYTNIENTRGNNWYMSLARSIYHAGVYFPEFKDAEKWRMRAEGATYKYMNSNIKGDGMNKETTENYHAYALQLADAIQQLGSMNGYSVLSDLSEQLERGGDLLRDITLPNFEKPMIGDSSSRNLSIASLMTHYFTYYGRDDFRYIGTNGAQGTVPSVKSIMYPNSMAFMKTGWDINDKYLCIENSDSNYAGSHNHPDDLSIMMYAYGKRLIVDPGVNNYLDEAGSNWLRKTTTAHNTVEINGAVQGNLNRRNIEWYSNDGFDFYYGRNSDYAEAYPTILHNRKVFFVKPNYWIVSDLLTGSEASATYRQLWHFMPTTVNLDAITKRASTSFAGEANVKLVPADPNLVSATVHTDGYYSDAPEVLSSNVRYLSYAKTAAGNVSFDTVLFPEAAGSNKNVAVTRLATGAATTIASAIKIEYDSGNNGNTGYYYLSHEASPGVRTFDAYNFNGEVAYIEKTSAGSLKTASIIQGSLLKEGTINLISAAAKLPNLSVSYSGSILDLSSSDVLTANVTIYAPGITTVRLNGNGKAFSRNGDFVTINGSSLPTTGANILTDNFGSAGLTSQFWDFENSSTDGFEPQGGTWSVYQAGTKTYRQSDSAAVEVKSITTSKWNDAVIQAEVNTLSSNGSYNGVGLYLRYQDSANYYNFQYYTNGGSPQLRIIKAFNGTSQVLSSTPYTMNHNTTYTLKAIASGNTLKFYVNNVLQLTCYDSDIIMGYAGLQTHRRNAWFDNVKASEIVDGDYWDILKGFLQYDNLELYAGSANEQNTQICTKNQNDWYNVAGEAKVKIVSWGTYPRRAGITLRTLNINDGYRFVVCKESSSAPTVLRIERLRSGVPPLAGEAASTVLAEVPYAINTGTYYTFRAVANGGVLKFFVNGVEQLSAYDSVFQRGGFGMYASGAEVRFDDVKVEMLP